MLGVRYTMQGGKIFFKLFIFCDPPGHSSLFQTLPMAWQQEACHLCAYITSWQCKRGWIAWPPHCHRNKSQQLPMPHCHNIAFRFSLSRGSGTCAAGAACTPACPLHHVKLQCRDGLLGEAGSQGMLRQRFALQRDALSSCWIRVLSERSCDVHAGPVLGRCRATVKCIQRQGSSLLL